MFGLVLLTVSSVSVILTQDVAQNDATRCGIGQFMDTFGNTRFCPTCPNGTFMAEDGHTNLSCKRCTIYFPEIDYVLQVKTCTRERDTIVEQCKEGFYVLYDSSLARYTCARCGATDCQQNAECCSSTTVTTTASTPNTKADITSTPPLKPNTYKHNATKCENVVTYGCLKAEHFNSTCVYYHDLTERSVECQKCPNINCNANNCTDKRQENGDTPPSAGGIAGIVVACVIFIVFVAVSIYCCYRRNKKRYLTYQIANGGLTDEAHSKKPATAVKMNCIQATINIEQC